MSGIKISQATPFSAAQDNDQFAAERGGTSGSLTLKKIAVQAGISEGFLKGNPSGVYAQNQTNDDKWQLDQKALNIFGGAAATVNPDCDQNDRFLLQVDAGGCTLQNPVNVPATESGMFYFQIQAFSAIDAVLTFGGNMIQLTGSCPYDNSGSENIIHCWKIQGGNTYYRVENTLSLGNLIGDPEGVTVQNQDNDDQWQLDQQAITLSGASPIPDLTKNDRFVMGGYSTAVEIQSPINAPSTNAAFYYRIYAQGTGAVTFDGNHVKLSGSRPIAANNTMNVIHCYKIDGINTTYYKVDSTLPLPNTVLTEIVTIPRAQVLTSFDTPVTLLAAPATGFLRQYLQITAYMEGGTGYTGNTSAQIRGGSTTLVAFSLGISTDISTMKVVEFVGATTIANTLIFQNTVGNPTGAAADDVHVAITYIDYPKPF